MPPAWVAGGSWTHPLGTDLLGRDILSRLIYGARTSFTVAALAVFFAGTVGTILGLISGYFGGLTDILLMRLTDIALSVPLILMAIILVAALGTSFTNVILVIVLLLWPRYARQVRGETLSIKERDFVALARIANCSHIRIIWRHIFPNVIPTLLVLVTLQAGYVVLLESTLSFLGVGIPPSTPAWGLMIAEGRTIIDSAWWVAMWPGLSILFMVLSGNLLGDWLRDRLDPTLKQV
jgi:peptide/nickel transport system permease protein